MDGIDDPWLGTTAAPKYSNWNKVPENPKETKYLYCVAEKEDPGTYRIGHGWDFYVPDDFVYRYYFNLFYVLTFLRC